MIHAQQHLAVFDLLAVARFLRGVTFMKAWAAEAMFVCIHDLGKKKDEHRRDLIFLQRLEAIKPRVERQSLTYVTEAMAIALEQARDGALPRYLEQMYRIKQRAVRQLLFLADNAQRDVHRLQDVRLDVKALESWRYEMTLAQVGGYLYLRSTPAGLLAVPVGWETNDRFRVCRSWQELPLAKATAFAIDLDAEVVRQALSDELGWPFSRASGHDRRIGDLWTRTLKEVSFWCNHAVQPFQPGRLSIESAARKGRKLLTQRTPARLRRDIVVVHTCWHRAADPHTLGTRRYQRSTAN